jgi:hypothetical protein
MALPQEEEAPNGPNGPNGPDDQPPRRRPRRTPLCSESSSSGFSDVDPEIPPEVHSVGSTPPPDVNPVIAHGNVQGEERDARERMFHNLDISEEDRRLLRRRARFENLRENVAMDRARRALLVELEALVASPDPHIRRKAEHDLRDVLDEIKGNRDLNSSDESESEHPQNMDIGSDNDYTENTLVNDPVVGDHDDQGLADMPDLEWDDMGLANPDPGPVVPGLPGAAALPIRGRNRRDVADWLAGVDPQERDDLGNQTMLEDLGFTPVTRTRTGRVVRPPVRYSDAEEDRRMRDEKEARDIVKAKRQSMGNVAPAESATRAVARHRANLELIQARKEVAEAEAKYRAEAKRLSMSKSADKTLTREEADRELAEARREVAEAERLHLREIVEAARLRLAEADAEAESS